MKNMLTLEAFADWASKQPAEKKYDYLSHKNCAYGQYLTFLGQEGFYVGGTHWINDKGRQREFLPGLEPSLVRAPRNFGALATRLRKASAP